jgi:hypothetical protein
MSKPFSFDFNDVKLRDPDELATAQARIQAHEAFDWLWRNARLYSRSRAYKNLSLALNIPPAECHIKQFDVRMCKRVIAYATSIRRELEARAQMFDDPRTGWDAQ